MANRDVIVVGASAGGVEALRELVAGLPPDLPATVLVVLHVPETGRSALPAILTRAGPLPARHPVDGQRLRRGEILVAPPNHHLTVLDGMARLTHGPRENGHRPAIDPLFRAVARWHGPRVIGVVLSGTLDDGTAGQVAIAAEGGLVLVQDPEDALYGTMPLSVLEHLKVDHVAPARALGALLGRLVREPLAVAPSCGGPVPEPTEETALVDPTTGPAGDPSGNLPGDPSGNLPGDPAGLGCPQCGGSLYAIEDPRLVRYRCRVGHVWSPESLLAEQSEALESALWMALRTLEDRAALCRRCEQSATVRGHRTTVERYRSQAEESEQAARVMRDALERAQRATRLVVDDGDGPIPSDTGPPR